MMRVVGIKKRAEAVIRIAIATVEWFLGSMAFVYSIVTSISIRACSSFYK